MSNCLNAATDINYYRSLAFFEGNSKNIKSDNWLLTSDKGLNEFSKCIFYIKNKGPCIKMLRKEGFHHLRYWIEADSLVQSYSIRRQITTKNTQSHKEFILENFIRELEDKIKRKLN